MKEAVLTFGTRPELFGILTSADRPRRRAALVLVNSGIVHRVGANRTTVALARHLAGRGYDSLRFDLSGLGDAPDRTDRLGWERSSPLEIRQAVAALCRETGAGEVVLYGNCGGAAKSFWAAQGESKVRGLLLTNPPPHPADPEFGTEVEAFSHGRWVPADLPRNPAPEIAQVLDRGTRASFVYAAGDVGERYFWKRLAPPLEAYLEDGRLTIARVENSNHTFASESARSRFLELATRWLTTSFAAFREVGG